MGANIIITEVNEPKTLTDLDELKTPKVGGGYEYWVRKSDTKLTTKHVSKNGTYTAKSDGYYGFDKVNVNVRGGNGSADSHGRPTGGDIKPGGAGSAVVGTDPTTGNDVVVGVDSTGTLVTTPIPTSIVLVTPPTKTDYNDGETIDLSGAVVVAKMADGTTWTDADHPNGHVSCTPEPEVASMAEVREKSASVDSLPGYSGPLSIYYAEKNGAVGYNFSTTCKVAAVSRHVTQPDYYQCSFIWAAEEPFTSSGQDANEIIMNGRRFYYFGLSSPIDPGTDYGVPQTDATGYTMGTNDGPYIAYIILFGTFSGGGQPITLNWARPGDGKVLSTTMEINVGAHSTESGSGGGGTF